MAEASGSALGLEAEGETTELDALLGDDPQPEETPAEPEAEHHHEEPTTPTPEVPETPEVEETPPETPAETPSEAPESPQEPIEPQEAPPAAEGEHTFAPDGEKWLGRFDTYDAAREGYKQSQAWGTRLSQEASELRSQLTARHKELTEVQGYLQQIAPQLRQLAEEQGIDPQQPQQDVQELVRSEAQKLFAQQQQEQTAEQIRSSVAAFRSEHPEAAGSAVEGDMLRIIKEYDTEAQDDGGWAVTKESLGVAYKLASDPRLQATLETLRLFPDPDYVEIAEELATNPGLKDVVMAHPHVVDSAQGMAWAREQVALPQHLQNTQQQQNAERQQANLDAAKKRAHVEKGSSGAPAQAAPGIRPELEGVDPDIVDLIQMDEKDRAGILGL